ncbi:DUF2848 family protein [Georgenia subflava]|uniref:DUF2848 domain-containing protein n=1 Tax=Georgenia subflava TaxID=1622177 RepID=A0A6N7EC40_9MICO|nr:DUF2848 family protein [Georgenia subflava]MPV35540.1 DUF2848 domain-containing protein [Georgenia subflava]
MSTPLTFEVLDDAGSAGPDRLALTDYTVVVAGYTGRDAAAVQHHIDELAAIGIPAPDSVPAFYPMDAALVTQDPAVTVAGSYTSGEVEPVLVRAGGELYLGVGSDHTDRDLERESVAGSKAACPKPVSRQVVRVPADLDWDAVEMASAVDGERYQSGTLRTLRVPTDVLALLDADSSAPGGDLVMFGGTLPLLTGTFVAGSAWELELRLPDGVTLRHSYTADRAPRTQPSPAVADREV